MSTPTRAKLIDAIGHTIAQWQDAVHAFDGAAAARLGLNLSDQNCLGLLARGGPMTPGQLAKASGLTPAAMTTAIDRWEAAGLARRVRSETDRRSVLVELTPRARQLIGEIWGPIVDDGNRLLSRYSTAELRLLASFVEACRDLQVQHAARLAAEVAAGKRP
jgi:DNA-binding MarR family transcriptional regulator